jgi:hypothetical protein
VRGYSAGCGAPRGFGIDAAPAGTATAFPDVMNKKPAPGVRPRELAAARKRDRAEFVAVMLLGERRVDYLCDAGHIPMADHTVT